jgi:integrase
VPDGVLDALRVYRRDQLELRIQLAMGRRPDDALLFTDPDGKPRSLYVVSSASGSFAGRIGIPDVTFHALRHTHASQLIDAGVDIVTTSKRLGARQAGHHLAYLRPPVQKDDSKAAAAINAALNR